MTHTVLKCMVFNAMTHTVLKCMVLNAMTHTVLKCMILNAMTHTVLKCMVLNAMAHTVLKCMVLNAMTHIFLKMCIISNAMTHAISRKNEMIFQTIIHDKQRISKQIHNMLCFTLFFQKKNKYSKQFMHTLQKVLCSSKLLLL